MKCAQASLPPGGSCFISAQFIIYREREWNEQICHKLPLLFPVHLQWLDLYVWHSLLPCLVLSVNNGNIKCMGSSREVRIIVRTNYLHHLMLWTLLTVSLITDAWPLVIPAKGTPPCAARPTALLAPLRVYIIATHCGRVRPPIHLERTWWSS